MGQAAADAVLHGPSQYPPIMGLDVPRQAAAEHYRRVQALDIDATKILVTSGGAEAPGPADHVIRLCFARPDAVIDEAGARLAAYRRSLND